jgi:D-psicose/D-tagatose/L-ribulose 3-epimerase
MQFMTQFYSPMVLGLGIVIWWIAFSRLPFAARFWGLGCVAAGGAIALWLSDKSMNWMGHLMNTVPVVLTAEVVWLFLTAGAPTRIGWLGIAAASFLSWGYYTLLRTDGVTADLTAERSFRWTETAEDKFLAEQKTAMKYCKTLIDQMVTLGCPSLIGPVYSVVGKADAVEPAQQKKEWALVVKNLKELAAYAEKRGRQICVEPLNRFETDFLNTCDQGLKLIRDVGSKALRLHLDTFHMNIEEKNQAAAIRKAGKLLGHFHACGSDRGTPGNDHIDWKPIATALRSVGYRGDVVIESFTTDVKVIARAAAIWRKMEPTRNEIAVKGLKFLKKALR